MNDVLKKEMQCPICLGVIRKASTCLECLQRFCRKCIDKAIRFGKKECPACRVHCPSRRSLRDDPKFDNIIQAFYPDLDAAELEDDHVSEEGSRRNIEIQRRIAVMSKKQREAVAKDRPSIRSIKRRLREETTSDFSSNSESEERSPVPKSKKSVQGEKSKRKQKPEDQVVQGPSLVLQDNQEETEKLEDQKIQELDLLQRDNQEAKEKLQDQKFKGLNSVQQDNQLEKEKLEGKEVQELNTVQQDKKVEQQKFKDNKVQELDMVQQQDNQKENTMGNQKFEGQKVQEPNLVDQDNEALTENVDLEANVEENALVLVKRSEKENSPSNPSPAVPLVDHDKTVEILPIVVPELVVLEPPDQQDNERMPELEEKMKDADDEDDTTVPHLLILENREPLKEIGGVKFESPGAAQLYEVLVKDRVSAINRETLVHMVIHKAKVSEEKFVIFLESHFLCCPASTTGGQLKQLLNKMFFKRKGGALHVLYPRDSSPNAPSSFCINSLTYHQSDTLDFVSLDDEMSLEYLMVNEWQYFGNPVLVVSDGSSQVKKDANLVN